MQAEKDLKWSVGENNDKITLRLIGELSRNTLLPLWNLWKDEAQRASFLSAAQIAERDIVWNLSQISRIDSAGFALLCGMIEDCRKMQGADNRLQIESPPSQLLTLADLFGLSDWIAPFIK